MDIEAEYYDKMNGEAAEIMSRKFRARTEIALSHAIAKWCTIHCIFIRTKCENFTRQNVHFYGMYIIIRTSRSELIFLSSLSSRSLASRSS